MSITIRTGNTALAVCDAVLDPHNRTGETIPFALDSTLPDYVWALYIDGRRVGALHPITESVIRDVRKALEKAGDSQPAPAKEPWQMTQAAFTEQALATDQRYQNALSATPHNAPIEREYGVKRAERAHAKAVLDALKAGADVADEVLADYAGWHRLKKEPQPEQTAPALPVETQDPVTAPENGAQMRLAL